MLNFMIGRRCKGSAFVEQCRTWVQFSRLFQTPVGKARLPLRKGHISITLWVLASHNLKNG